MDTQQDSMNAEEDAIKEIIQKYGETINLKTSPYLIAEIIRTYALVFTRPIFDGSSGPVPGSHGTPPPPPAPPPESIFR